MCIPLEVNGEVWCRLGGEGSRTVAVRVRGFHKTTSGIITHMNITGVATGLQSLRSEEHTSELKSR